MKKLGASFGLLMAVLFLVDVPLASGSRTTNVAVGSVTGPSGDSLRRALAQELESAPGVRLTQSRRASFVVAASVTRLDEVESRQRLELECEVSVFVSDRRGGAVRFILQGRAAARGAPTQRLRDTVIRAAVRGALRPLERGLATRHRR